MKYVWLESGDAVHQISEAESLDFTEVYATKKGVLKFWRGLGDIEFLTRQPNRMRIVWHRSDGENMLRIACRCMVHE